MNILALDSSTDWLSLALLWQGRESTREWQVQQKHAELTLPEIRKLLAEAEAGLDALDGLAFAVGPGSFTGLRIGCGIVQGLAYGLDKPVVGVPTLAALAAGVDGERILAVIDARMGELYLAGYERQDGRLVEIVPTGVFKPNALPALPAGDWTGAGSGFTVQNDALQAAYGHQLQRVDATCIPHARGVLQLALPEFLAGRAVPAHKLDLLYIRNKVALTSLEQAKLRAA